MGTTTVGEGGGRRRRRRERERETETETETERQTDRDRDRQTERGRDRQRQRESLQVERRDTSLDKIQKERGLSALGRSACTLQTNRSFSHELISELELPPT